MSLQKKIFLGIVLPPFLFLIFFFIAGAPGSEFGVVSEEEGYQCGDFSLQFVNREVNGGYDLGTLNFKELHFKTEQDSRPISRLYLDEFPAHKLPLEFKIFKPTLENAYREEFVFGRSHANYLHLEVPSNIFTEDEFTNIAACLEDNIDRLFETRHLVSVSYVLAFANEHSKIIQSTTGIKYDGTFTCPDGKPDIHVYGDNSILVNSVPAGYVGEDLKFHLTEELFSDEDVRKEIEKISPADTGSKEESLKRFENYLAYKDLSTELLSVCKNSEGKTILDYFPLSKDS